MPGPGAGGVRAPGNVDCFEGDIAPALALPGTSAADDFPVLLRLLFLHCGAWTLGNVDLGLLAVGTVVDTFSGLGRDPFPALGIHEVFAPAFALPNCPWPPSCRSPC